MDEWSGGQHSLAPYRASVTNYVDQQTLKPELRRLYVLPHQRIWTFDVAISLLVCSL